MTVTTGEVAGEAYIDLQCGRRSALENGGLGLGGKRLKEGRVGEVVERAAGLLG